MNFDELSETEQALIGKQQLLVKSLLAERNGSAIVAKQQLAVKAGLARAKAATQANN
jgi:hypothetical protein